MFYENFINLSNGKENIVNNIFSTQFINTVKSNQSSTEYNDIVLFNIFKTIIKIAIIGGFLGTFFLIYNGVCDNKGCNTSLIYTNIIIFITCLYIIANIM